MGRMKRVRALRQYLKVYCEYHQNSRGKVRFKTKIFAETMAKNFQNLVRHKYVDSRNSVTPKIDIAKEFHTDILHSNCGKLKTDKQTNKTVK